MFPPAVNVIFIKLDDDADWRYSVHLSENLRMLFYQSVIQSVVMFCSIAWLNGLTVRILTKLM